MSTDERRNDNSYNQPFDLTLPALPMLPVCLRIFLEDGEWVLEVKGRNGVRVNERKVFPDQGKVALSDGDLLAIAGAQFVFSINDA